MKGNAYIGSNGSGLVSTLLSILSPCKRIKLDNHNMHWTESKSSSQCFCADHVTKRGLGACTIGSIPREGVGWSTVSKLYRYQVKYIMLVLTPCKQLMPFPFCQAIQVLPAHVTSSAIL